MTVFRTPQEQMRANLLVKHFAGSHAYGTSLPTSDVDFRGIFVADPVSVRTPFYRIEEVEDTTEEDTKLYELAAFMKLALECNPNVVETLWVDVEDIVQMHPAFALLHNAAPKLLSRKIAFTTSGYALAQLKRIRGHNKWINNPMPEAKPQACDYVSMVQYFAGPNEPALFPRDFDLRKWHRGFRLVPFGKDVFGIYSDGRRETFNGETGALNDDIESEKRSDFGPPTLIVKYNRAEHEDAKIKWEQYWTWKKNRNVARNALEEQFGYDCYTDDTEFLTSTGWKKFDDVLDTDNLATFNELSQKIEYQAPTEKIDSLYTGNLYHITGYHVDTLTTANHNMFVRPYSRTTGKQGSWQYIRAAELPETFDTLNVIQPKKSRQLMPRDFNLQVLERIDLLNYLRLLGWVVSEGTFNFYENGKVKHAIISQSKPQSKLTQTLTKQINCGKIKCNEYVFQQRGIANHPERRWSFSGPLSQFLFDDCGHRSENKRLPGWCFFLTKREMTTLLIALLQGDGTQKNHQKHTYVYYTTSNQLADDVQRLALLCGYETSKYGPYDINSTFLTDSKMFHVHINMRPTQHRRHVRSASVKKIAVKDQRIVCFMVKNWTLITRRNGHVGLHGNTKHAMHLVRLMRMGKEALTEGILRVKRPDAQELIDVRNGKWTYEEVLEYAEMMDAEIKALVEKSTLPAKVDLKFAAQLVLDVQDQVWNWKG